METTIVLYGQMEFEVIYADQKLWFRATQVCKYLGFSNPFEALKFHCKESQYREWQVGKGRPALYLLESGLYRLILRSKKPEAIAFQDWVTEDVLPAVRKQGGYISSTITPIQAIALSDELAKIVNSEKRPWTPHFSKSWQKEACRLCKVTWKHPRMAQFINQTVYDFFPKNAIAKIRELNANGQAEHTAHHQYLTPEFDIVAYQQHLRDIESYMLASPDLSVFWRLMTFRWNKTFQLEIFEEYFSN